MRPSDRDAHTAPRLALDRWAHGGPREAERIITDGDLLLSHDWRAREAPAGRLGHDPRRSGMHAAILRVPGPSPRTDRAWGGRVRPQHADHRLSARDGGALALALRGAERCGVQVLRGVAPSDFSGREHATDKGPDTHLAG